MESIYEADFSDRSLGYRRGKTGAREISQQLSQELKDGTYRWIVEADIKSFFDEVDHDWLEEMLKQRIDDRAFVGLIRKWLKAGVMEPKSKEAEMPENGTPQGGIVSPILANIYLHYVLDLWIEKVVKKHCEGEVIFMRYVDDVIVGFEKKGDAERYLAALPKRLSKFHPRVAEDKSGLVKFNRRSQRRSFTWGKFPKNWKESWQIPTPRVVEHWKGQRSSQTEMPLV
ncbi:MAG: reverse transcriptase domain-containing protein [Akkermansiaceae bacterium]